MNDKSRKPDHCSGTSESGNSAPISRTPRNKQSVTANMPTECDRDSRRLERFLQEHDTFAMKSPFGCGRIALYRTEKGATLGAGYVPAEAAEVLLAEGRASWIGSGKTCRLVAALPGAGKPVLSTDDRLVDGELRTVIVNDRESPLLWLHRRKDKDGRPQISAREFAAGERFRAELTLAGTMPRVTMNWAAAYAPEERSASDPTSASDATIAARQRVRQACERLGSELSGLAIDVCGFLKGLDQIEQERRWPARSAKIVLRLALATLADHYGLEEEEEARGRAHGNRSWRAEDARPQGIIQDHAL